jgi:membrane peptidoglycan carboxypeptidase
VVDPGVASSPWNPQQVVDYGTGTAATSGGPSWRQNRTEDLYRDAWFVGAIPQLMTAVWVGFPQGQISMQPPTARIKVFGGTWPAQIWHAFMYNAVKRIPVKEFPSLPDGVTYVSVKIDVTQGCVANPFTPPQNIETKQYISGTEPTKVCKEPSSYQYLTVPSVIGLRQGEATSLLRASGFNVSVQYVASSQPAGTVVAQDPSGGETAQQTSTVTISVAEAEPTPTTATVPNAIGLTRGAATAVLKNAGFAVTVALQSECDAADPACDAAGVVWSQSPAAAEQSSARR